MPSTAEKANLIKQKILHSWFQSNQYKDAIASNLANSEVDFSKLTDKQWDDIDKNLKTLKSETWKAEQKSEIEDILSKPTKEDTPGQTISALRTACWVMIWGEMTREQAETIKDGLGSMAGFAFSILPPVSSQAVDDRIAEKVSNQINAKLADLNLPQQQNSEPSIPTPTMGHRL